jgi:hypothetical protein
VGTVGGWVHGRSRVTAAVGLRNSQVRSLRHSRRLGRHRLSGQLEGGFRSRRRWCSWRGTNRGLQARRHDLGRAKRRRDVGSRPVAWWGWLGRGRGRSRDGSTRRGVAGRSCGGPLCGCCRAEVRTIVGWLWCGLAGSFGGKSAAGRRRPRAGKAFRRRRRMADALHQMRERAVDRIGQDIGERGPRGAREDRGGDGRCHEQWPSPPARDARRLCRPGSRCHDGRRRPGFGEHGQEQGYPLVSGRGVPG